MKYGKPNGNTCLACANASRLEKHRSLVTLPNGEVVTYTAAANRKIRSTEEGRQKHNAASVKCNTARLKRDAWYRLKQQLKVETNQILKDLAVGRGTDYMCLKIFGEDRETVFARIDAQLTARGFKWEGHGTEWVLDHRKPLGLAQSSIELYQLCLLENTQVLTPDENRKKCVADRELIRQHESEV